MSLDVATRSLGLQVSRHGPPVRVPGIATRALRQHPRPRSEAASFLPQLPGADAERGGGGQAGDPGMSAPVSRASLELHNCYG